MILSIRPYGHPILRQKCASISSDYPGLQRLIDSMWETMYNAQGCGLAAPQVGHAIRLFTVDSKTSYESYDTAERETYFAATDEGIVETFINAQIIEQSDETWEDEEGCLSIPHLSQKVKRPWRITIRYEDRHFTTRTRVFGGITARMIQHEYDHTEGVLYLDYLQPLTKRMLTAKIKQIARRQPVVNYPMLYKSNR